jgi:hypothetical protein
VTAPAKCDGRAAPASTAIGAETLRNLNARSKTGSLAGAAAWLAPLGAGAVLRLWNLRRQILLDDEMHTVATALYAPVRRILSSWKTEDPCLPLAAFYRLLLEGGVRFSEMTFRAPIVAVSLATIVVLPWIARGLIGARAAVTWAWLLALSPVLAIYGGMVRPYAVIALLGPVATLAVLRWRASGRLAWGLGYAVLAALCLWFHLATAPLLLAPIGLLALETVLVRVRRRARDQPPLVSLRDLAIAAGAAVVLVAAFMVPLWQSLRDLYAAKSGIAPFSFELVPPIARLQSGVAIGPLAVALTVLFWLLTALGLVALARRQPWLALYLVGAAVAQWIGLAILAPLGQLNPIIFNRYLMGTLPLVLSFTAVALAAATERAEASWGRVAALVVAGAPLLVLLLAGPYADPRFRDSSFQHSKDFMRFDQPRGTIAADAVPSFYRSAMLRDAPGPIIEIPFRGGWSCTRAHYVYQALHREPVLAAEPFDWPCDERLRLRNHVCPRPAEMLRSPARFAIVHRNPLAEESLVVGGDDSGNRWLPEQWDEFTLIAGRTARALRRRWGAPIYRDDRVTVWDLDAVRLRTRRAPRAAESSAGNR